MPPPTCQELANSGSNAGIADDLIEIGGTEKAVIELPEIRRTESAVRKKRARSDCRFTRTLAASFGDTAVSKAERGLMRAPTVVVTRLVRLQRC